MPPWSMGPSRRAAPGPKAMKCSMALLALVKAFPQGNSPTRPKTSPTVPEMAAEILFASSRRPSRIPSTTASSPAGKLLAVLSRNPS